MAVVLLEAGPGKGLPSGTVQRNTGTWLEIETTKKQCRGGLKEFGGSSLDKARDQSPRKASLTHRRCGFPVCAWLTISELTMSLGSSTQDGKQLAAVKQRFFEFEQLQSDADKVSCHRKACWLLCVLPNSDVDSRM